MQKYILMRERSARACLRSELGDEQFRDSALVIVGHGSTLNPDSSVPTYQHASEIRKKGLFAEVEVCFWKEQPPMSDVFHSLDSREVFIVPNFISEGYFTDRVIPRELGLQGKVTCSQGRTLRYCPPVGSHPFMTQLLLKRAAEVAPGIDTSKSALLIVGHGTSLNDNSASAAKTQVALIRELGIYGQVESTYMEEPPLVSEWDSLTEFPTVIVVPFFIADGLHSYQDIPVLLGINKELGPAASQAEVFLKNPHFLRGRTLYYASAIGTESGFADIIVDQARRAPR